MFKLEKPDTIHIASHSGLYGGNLVRNTMPSLQAAYRQGADILEVDVVKSRDGVLYLFHQGLERFYLQRHRPLETMSAARIAKLDYYNMWGSKTGLAPTRLDDFLEEFKGKCLINLDHCWGKWDETFQAIERHGMKDQIIVKSKLAPKDIAHIAERGNGVMYMPMLWNEIDLAQLAGKVNLVAAELLFASPEAPLVSPESIARFHQAGILLWANAIVYDYKAVIGGGLTDSVAIAGDPENSWGALIGMGFDIIQTDFPEQLRQFTDNRRTT